MHPSSTALVLLLTAITISCNSENAAGDGAGSSSGSAAAQQPTNAPVAPSKARGSSTAALDGENKRMIDGVAAFSHKQNKLRVALSSFTLKAQQAKTMTDIESDMRMMPSDEPYLELDFTIKDPARPLSASHVEHWNIVFWNFGKGPMTLGKAAGEGILELSGGLEKGGAISLRLEGEEPWEMGEDKRKYTWALNHTVPVAPPR